MDHFYDHNTGDILMLINSDIILNCTAEFINKVMSISESCIPIAHRNDYTKNLTISKKYSFWFDVFFIHLKYIPVFPPAFYSMGQTWWDYWLPYKAIKNNVPVFLIEEPFAYHKEHPMQYNASDWIKMTEYFKWENNIVGNDAQAINDNIRNEIINASLSFKL